MPQIISATDTYFLIDGVPKQRGRYEIIRTGNFVGIRMGQRNGWLKGCELQDFRNYTDDFNNSAASPESLLTYLRSFIFIGESATIMTVWGSITGTLADQGDLLIALENKVDVITTENRIDSLSKLPAPVAGIITLDSSESYRVFGLIDLQGNEVVVNTASLSGFNQLVSGFANGKITISGGSKIIDFLFQNMEVVINAPLNNVKITDVSFTNCNEVLVLAAANIIGQGVSFLNSPLKIRGTVDSLVFSPNCGFGNEINPTAVLVDFEPTAIINRRTRLENSIFVTSFAGQTAVRVQSSATIGIESFIADNLRMQGLGTAWSGINGNDDRAIFTKVIGGNSINSTAIANMYMKDNVIATPTNIAGARYAMAGNTEFGAIRQKFIHDPLTNSLVYTSSVPRSFKILAPHFVIAPNNNVIKVYVGIDRNGLPIDPANDFILESESPITASGAARPELGYCQCVATLNQGDRVYLIVENTTTGSPTTIPFMNMIIEQSV